jgi:type II restriction enzyme
MEEKLMPPERAYELHLTGSSDLITTYEETRAGFVALALEKNRRATPFVEQARALKVAASQAPNPAALLAMEGIQSALLTAAGVSDKALTYLQQEDKVEAIRGLIANFLEPAGPDFVEELVYRFLLTRGDTLGGAMRNVGGVLAQRKLTRAIIALHTLAGTPYWWHHSISNIWLPMTEDDSGIELHLRGLSWLKNGEPRTIIFNLTVPLMKNNVDLCLINCGYNTVREAQKNPDFYIALGELKGGIDPAGADEHWKTASTALKRIRDAFSAHNLSPHTFFVGAAIAKKMAGQIWEQLDNGTLTNAANLTNPQQLDSLCNWLINL